ncbi:hypothetical protein [Canibacter zhoujuaniae]|uniref:hypothetical protein n=1 Tax=Canibacter zhoujuaniae TaxID=2708343 RepID=UPI00141E935E|nr:hypothetical protein [Canibacter zhoujuaniae]
MNENIKAHELAASQAAQPETGPQSAPNSGGQLAQLPLAAKISIVLLMLAGFIAVVPLLLQSLDVGFGRIVFTLGVISIFVTAVTTAILQSRQGSWIQLLTLVSSALGLVFGLLVLWVPSYGYYDYDSYSRVVPLIAVGLMFLVVWGIAIGVLRLVRARNGEDTTLQLRSALVTIALFFIAAILTGVEIVADVAGFYMISGYHSWTLAALIFGAVGVGITAVLVTALRPAKQTEKSDLGTPQPISHETVVAESEPPVTETAASEGELPVPDENGLLPWPTFADGTPLPADANGQPDFSVPGAPYPPHLLLQQQNEQ